MKYLITILFTSFCVFANAQNLITPFERSNGMESATYFQAINYYRKLDERFKTIDIQKAGATDVIYPLHVVYYSKDGSFDIKEWHRKNKIILLINNGIHPGETDGIDASMMLMRDAAERKINVPENVILAVIPVFNIGGSINRGSYSRANQNGPKEYGFRGNAENLDLNRDFIKMDAKETQSLVKLFQELQPDIFIDNHVSDGADYQHVMTLLSENSQKQGTVLGQYLANKLEPSIYSIMKTKGYDLVPYVNHEGNSPDKGWSQFYDPPRFTSGYATLYNCFPFVAETHMLKPYPKRVDATYQLMLSFIDYASVNASELKSVRAKEVEDIQKKELFTIDWQVDSSKFTPITFKGYAAKYKPSNVSGKERLYYDRNEPYTKTVPFYNFYKPLITANAPKAYVIPQGWHKIIYRLRLNGVKMIQLHKDSTMTLTVYKIKNYETVKKPYEGHYLHTSVVFTQQKEKIKLRKGDYVIPTQQLAKRYLLETLEPNAPDAFFAWNFFDAVLRQKEYFSDYVFEDEAAALLNKDPDLKKLLEIKKKEDTSFTNSGQAQLDFIYQHSPYMEPEYMRYPVFRVD